MSLPWLSIRVTNKLTGQAISVYHEPENGEDVDRHLRYKVLELESPEASPIKIVVRKMGEDWVPGTPLTARMTSPVARIWNELHVDKELAIDFIGVFARFEYALKRTDFLRDRDVAEPDWDSFARKVSSEIVSADLEPVFTMGAYLFEKPTKQLMVRRGALVWEEAPRSGQSPSLLTLLLIVRRTRNNLFHGGKFQHGEEEEQLRDKKLIQASIDVLLECLELNCPSAKRVKDVFWRFDAPT